MPDATLEPLVELTDADLDMVGGGFLVVPGDRPPSDRFIEQAKLPEEVAQKFRYNYLYNGFPVYSE